MIIDNSSGFQLNATLLKDITDARQHGNDADSATEKQANHSNAIQFGGKRDLLENNFVDRDAEQSRYVLGIMTGFQVQNDFRNKMNGVMGFYQADLMTATTYAERTLVGQKTAAAMGDAVDSEVTEQETKRLEKERQKSEKKLDETLEEKAEEKLKEQTAEPGKDAAASNAEATSPANRKSAEASGESTASSARNNEQPTVEPAAAVAPDTAKIPQHANTAGSSDNAPHTAGSGQSMTHVDIVV